jgi:hypothetical protein
MKQKNKAKSRVKSLLKTPLTEYEIDKFKMSGGIFQNCKVGKTYCKVLTDKCQIIEGHFMKKCLTCGHEFFEGPENKSKNAK